MKMCGGYLPAIPGRPDRGIRDVAVPERLHVDLIQSGLIYRPLVDDGSNVRFGQPLAVADIACGEVSLPAPAGGRVIFERENGNEKRLCLQVTNSQPVSSREVLPPERSSAERLRRELALGGLWPLIWSSANRGIPSLDGSETPSRIVVNCVIAEPFRTRGKVVLETSWPRVLVGLGYLQRLLTGYGSIHLVLTEASDPLAVSLRNEMAGHAWVRLEHVPLRFPIEHPYVSCRTLRRARRSADGTTWVLNIQTVAAIGACLGEGYPLHERIVAVGGPGAATPAHARVRIGTPLDAILEPADRASDRRVLKGGLFQGVAAANDAVINGHDDAIFVLPRPEKREFMGFAQPGFDRASIMRCFASRLTGAVDRKLTTALRGERRPCIACGLCEQVCPVDLMPQVLHRYLYRDAIDEAERAGLPLCIGCGLCSFVCPSKIELTHQFAEAQERLHAEHRAAAEAEAAHARQEEARQHEKTHREDSRQ